MTLDALALTRRLLSFNTVNPPGDERDCARYIGKLLEDSGFATGYFEFADRRTTLIARLAGASDRPPICFTGHLDTVPLGAASWARDPFAGTLDGDRLYGRGTSDMKSGVAAILLMALRLAPLKNRRADLTLILTAGEETTCQGAEYVAGLEGVLGEAGAIVAGEPTANAPLVAHKGCIRFEVTTKGIAAHASMPDMGVNALYRAADLIKRLAAFEFVTAPHTLLGKPTLAVTMCSAGTAINVIPDRATIRLDIRTLPGQSEATIRAELETLLGGDAELRRLSGVASVGTDTAHQWVHEVFEIMEQLTGSRPLPAGASYFTDCSVLTPAYGGPPTIILGPGEPELAHKTDEFCHLSKIELAVEAYAEIARRWCGA